MDDTVIRKSPLGERLDKIKQGTMWNIHFGRKKVQIVSKLTIGRDQSNDIVLNDKMCSRNHAIIQKIKEDYFIKDLGSTNGTYVNEEMIPKDGWVKIQPKDVIRIGKSKLKIG